MQLLSKAYGADPAPLGAFRKTRAWFNEWTVYRSETPCRGLHECSRETFAIRYRERIAIAAFKLPRNAATRQLLFAIQARDAQIVAVQGQHELALEQLDELLAHERPAPSAQKVDALTISTGHAH